MWCTHYTVHDVMKSNTRWLARHWRDGCLRLFLTVKIVFQSKVLGVEKNALKTKYIFYASRPARQDDVIIRIRSTWCRDNMIMIQSLTETNRVGRVSDERVHRRYTKRTGRKKTSAKRTVAVDRPTDRSLYAVVRVDRDNNNTLYRGEYYRYAPQRWRPGESCGRTDRTNGPPGPGPTN